MFLLPVLFYFWQFSWAVCVQMQMFFQLNWLNDQHVCLAYDAGLFSVMNPVAVNVTNLNL